MKAWYAGLLAAVAAERVAELVTSRRNTAWSLARGGIETGQGHYPVMVALHTGLLGACVAEPLLRPRPESRVAAVGVLAAHGLRWWCIRTLGRRWSTRVVVVPGARRVTAGPYRLLRHPNYVAVVAEGVALPLAGGARWAAAVFTLANALLLRRRLQVEEAALGLLA